MAWELCDIDKSNHVHILGVGHVFLTSSGEGPGMCSELELKMCVMCLTEWQGATRAKGSPILSQFVASSPKQS